MKTKLFYIASYLLVFFTSCSVDENTNDFSTYEKEIAVKNLFDTFSKNVINSSDYSKFIDEVKTKSSSELTEEGFQKLEQEFLSQQSLEFVELYNFVKSLNLTKEELRQIVLDYLSASKNKDRIQRDDKNDGDDCAVSDSINSPLFVFLAELVCEISRTSRD